MDEVSVLVMVDRLDVCPKVHHCKVIGQVADGMRAVKIQ